MSPQQVARVRAKARQTASQSVWSGDGAVIKSEADNTRERIEVEAAEEMAAFMDVEHEGKYCAVLSAHALLKGPWTGSMDLIEVLEKIHPPCPCPCPCPPPQSTLPPALAHAKLCHDCTPPSSSGV